MKNFFLQLFIALLFTMTADAGVREVCAEDGHCADMKSVYAKIFSGANFLQDTSITGNNATYQPGYIIAGSVGYCWRYGLHGEVEYAFRRNEIKEINFFTEGDSNQGHFQTSSYMANLLWRGCECWNFRPLIGVGVGYDFQQMTASNSRVIFNQKWHVFSWQVTAGFAYTICCNTELALEYKFHQGDYFNNHAIELGLFYKFLQF